MEDEFSVSIGVREGVQIVVVRGDLDEVTTDELDTAIDGCRDGWPVIIDLSGVEFMSSAGLHAVLRDRRAQTALVCPPGNVARLFEIVLPPASPGCCDSPAAEPSHLRTVPQRLVAHHVQMPQLPGRSTLKTPGLRRRASTGRRWISFCSRITRSTRLRLTATPSERRTKQQIIR
jgi:anti-anti-sigma factor